MEWRDSAAHYIKKIKSRNKKDALAHLFCFIDLNLYKVKLYLFQALFTHFINFLHIKFQLGYIIIRSQSGGCQQPHLNNHCWPLSGVR